jgi:hypothetical protein
MAGRNAILQTQRVCLQAALAINTADKASSSKVGNTRSPLLVLFVIKLSAWLLVLSPEVVVFVVEMLDVVVFSSKLGKYLG